MNSVLVTPKPVRLGLEERRAVEAQRQALEQARHEAFFRLRLTRTRRDVLVWR